MWVVDGMKCEGLLPQKGYPRCGKRGVALCRLSAGGLWVCRQCYGGGGEMGISRYKREGREAAALAAERVAVT